jgi:D-glycero-D-manno-heptose 1,7-bisphosphate phosphatase
MTEPSPYRLRPLRPALFLDRDGTLTRDSSGYTFKPEALELLPNAAAAVRRANEAGLTTVVVTNQSGVARGYFTEADVWRFHAELQDRLAAHGAWIDAYYYCPYLAEAPVKAYSHPDHPDRKPNPGMLIRAMLDFGLDPARSSLIGDSDGDIAAAAAAQVLGLDVRTTPILEAVEAALIRARTTPRHGRGAVAG